MGGITKAALKRKKPISDDYFVPADDAQAAELKAAESRVSITSFMGSKEDRETAAAELKEVQDRVRKDGLVFHIVSIGRVAFEELVREHPPTDEQAGSSEQHTFNPVTFWPALFEASIESNGLTADDWRTQVLESADWGSGELYELRKKVEEVNTGTRVANLGN